MTNEELIWNEVNCTTGEKITRSFTDEERAVWEARRAEAIAQQAAEAAEATRIADLKASAKAKLVAGQPLTEEEAATIVL